MSVYDKCKLQRLFEMYPFRTDTCTKSWTPLADRVVDDALLQTVPHVNQTLSHGPYGPVHCPAEKLRSRQKLHGYRAASPVWAAHPNNMLHLFWCQGPRIWGGFGPASTHRQIPWWTLWKLSECTTTNPLQCSSSLTLQERRHDRFADFFGVEMVVVVTSILNK